LRTFFPLESIRTLVNRAAHARRVPSEGPEGWTKSEIDPKELLQVFDPLRLKSGYTLHAYQFRSGLNGNGVIWAMKEEAVPSNPIYLRLHSNTELRSPKPVEALDNILEAIEGDGTPWSYLCASIFMREAREFGALWHGCSWSNHTIIDANPFHETPGTWSDETKVLGDQIANRTIGEIAKLVSYLRRVHDMLPVPQPSRSGIHWKIRPDNWLPCCFQEGNEISIRFFSYTRETTERIVRHCDFYQAGSYVCNTKEDSVAIGPSGYVC
jgi:hypothetical protein